MKKIYTFTLDDSEVVSEEIRNNFRLLAFLLYDEINNYDIDRKILVKNNHIKCNRLFESFVENKYYYRFESNKIMDGKCFFEPFIISDISFGITVYENSIGNDEVLMLLQEVKKLLKFNKDIYLDHIYYDANKDDDESKRVNAMKKIIEKVNYVYSNSSQILIRKKLIR